MSRVVALLRRRTAVLSIVAALAAALVALVVVDLVVTPRDGGSASPAAVRVARTEALNFFTLDHRHIDAQLAAVQKLATGSFKTQYAMKASTIRAGVVAASLTSTASIAADSTGVEYRAPNQEIVIVGIDSTTTTPATGTASSSTKTSRYRMRITVEKRAGSWLVSSIEQVG